MYLSSILGIRAMKAADLGMIKGWRLSIIKNTFLDDGFI